MLIFKCVLFLYATFSALFKEATIKLLNSDFFFGRPDFLVYICNMRTTSEHLMLGLSREGMSQA